LGVPGTNVSPRLVVRNTTPGILLRVTDSNGCVSVAGPVGILVDTLPKVRLLKDTALVIRDNMPLTAVGGPANAEVYEWFKGDLLLGQTAGNVPVFETSVTNTSVYSVTLSDSNGCQVSDSILIKVSNEVFIPNSFSPNKDGNNDRLKVYGYGVKTIEFRIFDRLGNVVYETNRVEDIVETSEDTDTVPGWDGTKEGKDVSQESYIWSIKGTFETGEPLRVTGGNLSGSVIILN
jgi:gliding motility-associated-like protein